jgi:ABC-type transport system involved in cytochrome bd biosynthesis fused ATPase/permease subunit
LPDDHTPELKFENVHFSFPQSLESEILDGVTFSIRPGEKVAITGQSGCGYPTYFEFINFA